MKRSKPLKRTGRLRRSKPDPVWLAARAERLRMAGNRCERCGCASPSLHVHHVLPRSRGGTHDVSNLRALDFACHGAIHDHAVSDWSDWIASSKGVTP